MHKRIKELAETADIEFTYDPFETPVRAFAECWEDELEKFAVSIVNECVRIIEHGMDHTDYDDPEKSMVELKAQKWCRDAIKEHFGVK